MNFVLGFNASVNVAPPKSSAVAAKFDLAKNGLALFNNGFLIHHQLGIDSRLTVRSKVLI